MIIIKFHFFLKFLNKKTFFITFSFYIIKKKVNIVNTFLLYILLQSLFNQDWSDNIYNVKNKKKYFKYLFL